MTEAIEFGVVARELYKVPAIERESLFLQDRFGLNVNILLFCLWQARVGHNSYGVAFFAETTELLSQWHEIAVLSLRRARRALKASTHAYLDHSEIEAFRASILTIEIEAEEFEQRIIARHAAKTPDENGSTNSDNAAQRSRAILQNYLIVRRVDDEPEVLASIARLIDAADLS